MNISQLRQIYHTVPGTTDSFYTTAVMTMQQSIKYQNKLAYNQYTATDKIDLTELKGKKSYLWNKDCSPFEDKSWLGKFLVCLFL